jgi:hypothetical protein
VYRGVLPLCTACGALRPPLSGRSVNLAGKPSKLGGRVSSVLGWLVLLVGLSVTLGVGLLVALLGPVSVALAVALPLGAITLGIAIPLLVGGTVLRRSGTEEERNVLEHALLSMLAEQGRVDASRAAAALAISTEQADALLTALAKSQPDRVAVDVGEDGTLWFRSAQLQAPMSPWDAATSAPPPPRQRVRLQETNQPRANGAHADAGELLEERSSPQRRKGF